MVRMARSTLTTKGQITIPKAIRDRLGLDRGDELSFELREDGVVEVRPLTGSILDLHNALSAPEGRGVTLEEMDEAIRRSHGEP